MQPNDDGPLVRGSAFYSFSVVENGTVDVTLVEVGGRRPTQGLARARHCTPSGEDLDRRLDTGRFAFKAGRAEVVVHRALAYGASQKRGSARARVARALRQRVGECDVANHGNEHDDECNAADDNALRARRHREPEREIRCHAEQHRSRRHSWEIATS